MKEETIKLIKLLVELDDSMLPCELERIASLIEPKVVGIFGIGISKDFITESIRDESQKASIVWSHRIEPVVKSSPSTIIGPPYHRCHCQCRC